MPSIDTIKSYLSKNQLLSDSTTTVVEYEGTEVLFDEHPTKGVKRMRQAANKSMFPQKDILKDKDYDRLKNRIYFICKDYAVLDEEGQFYLNKSIANLKVNQSAQNPITYLSPQADESHE